MTSDRVEFTLAIVGLCAGVTLTLASLALDRAGIPRLTTAQVRPSPHPDFVLHGEDVAFANPEDAAYRRFAPPKVPALSAAARSAAVTPAFRYELPRRPLTARPHNPPAPPTYTIESIPSPGRAGPDGMASARRHAPVAGFGLLEGRAYMVTNGQGHSDVMIRPAVPRTLSALQRVIGVLCQRVAGIQVNGAVAQPGPEDTWTLIAPRDVCVATGTSFSDDRARIGALQLSRVQTAVLFKTVEEVR